MRIVETIAEVRALVAAARASGRTVGFVPTMGFLHEGHLTLVDEARRRADLAVMSIFVNPLQFGPREDLARYPRDPVGDAAKAAARGVDVLFTPNVEAMYPAERAVMLVPQALDARWEGEARPGHFAGVLTVVAKLFNIVQPDVAVFGQKDFQQAAVVRAMARDLDVPVEIVVAPTVREADGLALSSRNSYLDGDARARALGLFAALREVQRTWRGGESGGARLAAIGRARLESIAGVEPDYLAVVDAQTLAPVADATAESVVLVAARIGGTRLIDNVRLGTPLLDPQPVMEPSAPRGVD